MNDNETTESEAPTIEDAIEALSQLAPLRNLSEQVEGGSIEHSPFQESAQHLQLFKHIARRLFSQSPRHVLIVGDRGIGQSAILADMALRASDLSLAFLNDHVFVSIDCKHVPPEESRGFLIELFAILAPFDELVVCIEGFSALLRSETAAGNRSRLLSYASQIRSRIVGLISPHDFEDQFAIDGEALEVFAPLHVREPDPDVAKHLLARYAAGMSDHFGIAIADEAVRSAVVLTHHYIQHDRLPHKAVKILQAACEEKLFDRQSNGQVDQSVDVQDVVDQVALATGIPHNTLNGVADDRDYHKSLGEMIVGQDHAIEEVATELGLINAGFTDRNKPASVMLFVGQTGTGKTEMAKALAQFYSSSKRLKIYTLGNYSEAHSVSGIIGVPAGYVGHDSGGRLINELIADPYGVFLLDEADKAHPDVMQPFLNLFDEGWICDQRDTKAHADRAIFILTTNVAQRQIAEMCRQKKPIEEINTKVKELLSQIRHTKSNRPVFSPEFIARIKRIIVFQALNQEAMEGIASRMLGKMEADWKSNRNKTLEYSEELVKRIGEAAHAINDRAQGKEGGRIVRKLISDQIESRIQRAISQNPDDYRGAEVVRIKLEDTDSPSEEPEEDQKSTTTVECEIQFVSSSS